MRWRGPFTTQDAHRCVAAQRIAARIVPGGRGDELEVAEPERLAPIELGDLPKAGSTTPRVCTDAERHHEASPASREGTHGGHVEVVEVIVRDDHYLDGRQRLERIGGGWKRLGPTSVEGEARSLKMGSVRSRWPSISTKVEAWPIQVARSPDGGGRP